MVILCIGRNDFLHACPHVFEDILDDRTNVLERLCRIYAVIVGCLGENVVHDEIETIVSYLWAWPV